MRQKSDFIYKEVRLHVRHKFYIPCFYPHGHGLVVKNGHVSLYSVTKEVAKKIQLSGSIKGWMPVHYSSVCWIDVDDLESGDEVEQRCKELGFFYARYFSGRKGWHFAIKRKAEPCTELYAKDRVFVRKFFSDLPAFNHFDLSIYHPMHLFRGIGCRHEVTRLPKKLVSFNRGQNIIDISEYPTDAISKRLAMYSRQSFDDNSWTTLRNAMCWHNGPEGSRYTALWQLAKDLFRNGMTRGQVQILCEVYNDSFDNPHDAKEVDRAIGDAAKAIAAEYSRFDNSSGD